MKRLCKTMCIFLAVVMTVGMLTLGMSSFAVATETSCQVGDIIEFGSYPQSRITNLFLINRLNVQSQSVTWTSYGYYSGDGNCGSMEPGDWMLYCDTFFDGVKYRGVKILQYRPEDTFKPCDSSPSHQKTNGFDIGITYWFKWEPIQWRVLDPSTGFVMSEKLIDSQAFCNTVYKLDGLYYNDAEGTNYATDYATSSIRHWLTNSFYQTAFSSTEQASIQYAVLDNTAYDSQYNSVSTTDKIYLLSVNDVLKKEYGFSSTTSTTLYRTAYATDYGKSQGMYCDSDGSAIWWLRNAGKNSGSGSGIGFEGGFYASGVDSVWHPYEGIRPAMILDPNIIGNYVVVLNENTSTTNSTYVVNDIIEFGYYPQTKVTDSNTVSILNAQTSNSSWISYSYYSGDGNRGSMEPGDWMLYCDKYYNGIKYRGVRILQYRPADTFKPCDSSPTYQKSNGYLTGQTYWFKWEPIQWRVLDPSTGLVMSEKLIDSQAFCDTVYHIDGANYNDAEGTNYATDYATSSIRYWLSNTFYNDAFSPEEQTAIPYVELVNTANDPKYNSSITTDKVFLLSTNDVLNTSYGFSATTSTTSTRTAYATDYGKCQGMYCDSTGSAIWWLRNAGNSSSSGAGIGFSGGFYASGVDSVWHPYEGIRPAMHINLSDNNGNSIWNENEESERIYIINDGLTSFNTTNHLAIGETYQLKAFHYPSLEDVTTGLTWYSSDPAVVSVNNSGVVTGVSKGYAYIYAKTSSGLSAKHGYFLYVGDYTITGNETEPIIPETNPKIYSLSISGISDDERYGTNNDSAMFYTRMYANKLEGYEVLKANQHAFAFSETSLTTIHKLLSNNFQNATDNDLSFFFFSGHSLSINGIPVGISLGADGYISWTVLANMLCEKIKGDIVVVLDCCHAGYFINEGILNNENLTDADILRIHVLASCGKNETSKPVNKVNSILYGNLRYGCFSFYLGQGIGFVNDYPEADSSGDGIVSLRELFKYISPKTVSNDMTTQIFGSDIGLYQTVQSHTGDGSFWAVGREFDANIDYYTTNWDSTAYNANLAATLCAFSAAVYNPSDIQKAYNSFGFEFFKLYDYDLEFNPNKCGYSLGFKHSDFNDDIIFLISARGSSNISDWYGNLALATFEDEKHMGFANPANQIYENIQHLIATKQLTGNIKFVITGHSRGAAVANLLAVKLMESGVPASNIYDYNFACPDVACKRSFPSYGNIYNLCNREDIVPYVPGKLADEFTYFGASWGKFGKTYWFTKDAPDTINPFADHNIWLYMEFFDKKLNPGDWGQSYTDPGGDVSKWMGYIGWIIEVFCPVDVMINDVNGMPLASVIDGQVNYYDSTFGDVVILTDGDKKVIYINGDRNFNVELIGTDAGTMRYSVEKYNLTFDTVLEEKTFSEVTLTDGKQMFSPVSEAAETSDIELFVVQNEDEKTVVTHTVNVDGSETPVDNGESDTPEDQDSTNHQSNCACGQYHTGPFAGLIKFFHSIIYFFKNLFGIK